MDAEHLDRIRAHVAQGGHLSAEVAHDVLSHCAAVTDEMVALRHTVNIAAALADEMKTRAEVWRADADRLAAWIVAHPGDHHDVLTAHDRVSA